jgi:hypothetical protein
LDRQLTEAIADDQVAQKEVARIKALPEPKSQQLLTKDLDEASNKIQVLEAEVDQNKASHDRLSQMSQKQSAANEAIDSFYGALSTCGTARLENLNVAISRLKSSLAPFGYFPDVGFVGLSESNAPPDANDATVILQVKTLLRYDGASLCNYLKANNIDANKVKQDSQRALTISLTQHNRAMQDQDQKLPRIKSLLQAWTDRKNALEKGLEQGSGTAQTIAGNLGWIIAAFCTFAIVIFLILMKFPDGSRMELIQSGQMIQFATVMVLLIIICVLGMSKFITDSTLGTLLGGISGYVLSQGVGRQERHAAQPATTRTSPPTPASP